MKLKQVLFGSLLLAVPFAACTNEDLMDTTVSSTPEEVLSKAVSLGDNFSIVGTKGISADTKAVVTDDFSTLWEVTDTVGGAWYAIPGNPSGEFIDDADKKLFSNHPFAFSKDLDEMKKVEFKANTNAFAGKYLLYYPYDHTVAAVSGAIPVEFDRNPVMDCTEGKTMEHLNLFAWCDATFEKGGSQAGEFALKQAGNIAVIKVGAKEKSENVDAILNKKIQRIIVESTGKLNDKGSIKVNASLTDYAKMAGEYKAADTHADSYILTPTNAGADYVVTGAGEAGMTKKAFYFSMLPAENNIDALTVKVLLEDGKVYKAEFKKDNEADKKVFDNIVLPGKKVTLNVLLDEEVQSSDIYTTEQFVAAMAKSIVGATTTIKLGADITLESLEFNKPGKTVNIEGGTLTVKGDLKVVDGTLDVKSALIAKGNVNVAGGATLTAESATEIGAVTVAQDGTATIKHASAGKVASVEVATFGTLTLEKVAVSGKLTIGRSATAALNGVTLKGTTVNNGKVTFGTTASINEGTFTSTGKDNDVTLNIALTNKGTMSFEGETLTTTVALTNNKMLSLNGTTVTGNAGVSNGAGGTLNVSGATVTISKITNAAATSTQKAGIVNIDMDEKTTALTAEVDNSGVLNINKGTLTEIGQDKVAIKAGGVMDIKKEGVFKLNSSTDGSVLAAGSVIKIVDNANIDLNSGAKGADVEVQMEATDATTLAAAISVTNVTAIVLNGADLAISNSQAGTLKDKHLILKKSIVFADDVEAVTMTKALDVDGDVTISTLKADGTTITLVATTTNVIKGSLTLGENVTLEGNGSGSVINIADGRLNAGDGTLTETNITYKMTK